MKSIRALANKRIDYAIFRMSDWISRGRSLGSHLDHAAKISGSPFAPGSHLRKSFSETANNFGLRPPQ